MNNPSNKTTQPLYAIYNHEGDCIEKGLTYDEALSGKIQREEAGFSAQLFRMSDTPNYGTE